MTTRAATRTRELASDPAFAALVVAFVLRIVLAVLAFHPQLFDSFALTKSALSHVCTSAIAALLLWLAIRYGRAVLPWSRVHVAVGLVLVFFALATLFAVDRDVAIFGAWRRYLGLTQMLDHAIVYVAAAVIVRSRQALIALVLTLLGASAIVVLYGVLQAADKDPFRFVRLSPLPISTFGNPDMLGGYLSIAASTFGALGVLLWRRTPRWFTAAALGVALACAALLFFTGIRNGVLGIGGGSMAAAAIAFARARPGRNVMLAIGGGIVLAAAIILVSPVGARLSPAFLQSDRAVLNRLEIWRTAIDEARARPLLGVGPDNYGVVWFSMRTPQSEQLIELDFIETSTHGWPFYFLTSAGVLGLGAFLAAVLLSLAAAWRLARAGDPLALAAVPLVAYLAQGLVDVNDISLDWTAWAAMGLLAGASGTVAAIPARPRRAWRAEPAFTLPDSVGWALVAIALVGALLVQLPRAGASRAEILGQARLNAGAQAEAVGPETAAVQLDPRRAEYWSSLGTAYAGTNVATAMSAFLAAAERSPWDRLHWMNIAITQRAVKNNGGALAAARRAVAADPSSSRAHRLLASVMLDLQAYDQAAAEGEIALALISGPGVTTPAEMFEEPILANIRLARWPRAIELSRRAASETNLIHYHLRLAQSLAGAAQYAEAKKELDIVLRATPNDPEAKDLADFLASKQ